MIVNTSILNLFREHVVRSATSDAVISHNATFSYGEVNTRANQLANFLIARGAKQGDTLGLCLDFSPDWIIGMLAILKTGGTCVPLDAEHPVSRLNQIAQSSKLKLVVTRPEPQLDLDSLQAESVCLRALANHIDTYPVEDPDLRVEGDHPAFVIHTSGSTGTPKGVLMLHKGFTNLAVVQKMHMDLDVSSRVLMYGAPSHANAIISAVVSLLLGAALVVAPYAELVPDQNLVRLLRDRGITHLHIPPSALAALPAAELPALRVLMSGGEALGAHLVRRWIKPERRFFNTYGTTESNWLALGEIKASQDSGVIPIGRPIDNMSAFIVDSHLRPVADGEPGELLTCGIGLAAGYLHRPELTKESFIDVPRRQLGLRGPGQLRCYRTGDRARRRDDGQLELLGRVDSQVKIRGVRVELGEVEAALLAAPNIQQAAVVAHPDMHGDTNLLVAYFVSGDGSTTSTGALRDHLSGRLPKHMVPSLLIEIETLPLLENGKLDRSSLPEPLFDRNQVETRHVAPATSLEVKLVQIWQDILMLEEPPGINDNFFDLGGHSLLASRVVVRIGSELGRDTSVRDFYATPTISALARVIEDADDKTPRKTPVSVPREQPIPLSFAQAGVWFRSTLNATSGYNTPLLLSFEGELCHDSLEHSLCEIARRHDILRTTYLMVDENPAQYCHENLPIDLPLVDIATTADTDEIEAVAQAEVSRFVDLPFDLEAGPIWRAELLRLGPTHHWLAIVIHHIATDGWSLNIVQNELQELYGAFRDGRPATLPELSVQYADFSAQQRNADVTSGRERELAYWREQLADAPTLHGLPVDFVRPEQPSFESQRVEFTLDPLLTRQLSQQGRDHGASLFMTLLAGFAAVLSRHTGQRDWVIGAPLASRPDAQLEPAIGLFVNILALRMRWSEDPTWSDLLRLAREQVMDALSYDDMPFEKLVEELNPQRRGNHEPLVQILLALHNTPTPQWSVEGLHVQELAVGTQDTRFELECHVWEIDGQLEGHWVFKSALFDHSTISLLNDHYAALLSAAIQAPDTPLSQLPMWHDGEAERLLTRWNETTQPGRDQRGVHQLFEDQAERSPEAPALLFEDERLSYRDLNKRANQIAHQLIADGLELGDTVGLCLERSSDLVAAMLGCLKAGAAYLPLDPNDPVERLRFILQDCGASEVITTTASKGLFDEAGIPCLCTDDLTWTGPDANPAVPVHTEQLAYVIYTSGSTGTPKGVAVTHDSVRNLICNTDYCQFGADRVFLHLSSPSFDLTTFEVWGALLHGAQLVVAPPDKQALDQLPHLISRHGITTAWLTASHFNQIVDANVDALAGLDELLIGGEALSPNHVSKALASLPGTTLINGYGPTESTTFTTTHEISTASVGSSIPIGRPIANIRVYVLDAALQPVPTGVPGELCIAGAGLAHGYVNRPDLTSERFIEIEISGRTERIYRSGDLARWRADGTLDYLGRLDQQLKIRGYRIEAGEVENAIIGQPSIKEAVVQAHPDGHGSHQLVAYIVPDQSTATTLRALRTALTKRLPNYMVPTAFVTLDGLPLTPNGKVDHAALPAPTLDRTSLEIPYVPATSTTETALAHIWQDVLMLEEPPGINDNFFDLGGHSLLSARLLARAEESLHARISLRTFFDAPTIASMATAIESSSPAEASNASNPAHQRLLDPAAHRELVSYSGSWQGHRAGPDSLICGHNLQGTKAPIFWVFQGEREMLQLAKHLGDDQPLYGMRSGHLVIDYTEDNIQAIALDYVREIQALNPTGPIIVGANCQGGLIALAIAQHLLRRRHHVPLLMLLEWNSGPQPYAGPVGLIFGRESELAYPYERFPHPEQMWRRAWPDHAVELIPGRHGHYFSEPNVQALAGAIDNLIGWAEKTPLRFLPEEAWQYDLQINDPPSQLSRGERAQISLTLTNASTVDWPDGETFGLTVRGLWLGEEGPIDALIGGSAYIPKLQAGTDTGLSLSITAPMESGSFHLALLVVEEGVPWDDTKDFATQFQITIEG